MSNMYEKKTGHMRKENIKDVLKNTKEYQKNLKSYADKYGYELEYLQQIIHEDMFLVNQIAKNPTKQNIYEIIAKEYISENYKEFKEFAILPKKSKNSIYLSNGQILKQDILTTSDYTKSIDFYWQYKDFEIYATHKYTKESGGSQDNQYQDVKNFLEHAKKNTSEKVIFAAICDGCYYNDKKLNVLKQMVLNSNCVVCDIYNLKKELDNYINSKK